MSDTHSSPNQRPAVEGLAPVLLRSGDWQARVAPQYGMNMLSLTHCGCELLRVPETESAFLAAPETFGTPPLMPASRTADARFAFDGVSYALPMNEPQLQTHKHGRLHQTAFDLRQLTDDSAVGVYQNVGELYPFPFTATISCKLSDDGYTQTYDFQNDGEGPMPVIFAVHAAFSTPKWCKIPIGDAWELDERNLPTGAFRPLTREEAAIAAGGAPPQGAISSCFVANGRCAELGDHCFAVSERFTQWIVWNGGGGKGFLCVEPQSGPINALNTPSGAIRVAAGETLRFTTHIGRRRTSACIR